jgi:hypothetical protein
MRTWKAKNINKIFVKYVTANGGQRSGGTGSVTGMMKAKSSTYSPVMTIFHLKTPSFSSVACNRVFF